MQRLARMEGRTGAWRGAWRGAGLAARAASGGPQRRLDAEKQAWQRRSPFYEQEDEAGQRSGAAAVTTLLPAAHGDERVAFEAPDVPLFAPPSGDGLRDQLVGKGLRVSTPTRKQASRDGQGRAVGIGKKKCAVARVLLGPGLGHFSCNGRSLVSYFPGLTARSVVLEPLMLTERLRNTDVVANVHGGGYQGQAEAVRHAISKALEYYDPEYRPLLKKAGLLTRDPRVVERKKPGKPKARKSFQWLKR